MKKIFPSKTKVVLMQRGRRSWICRFFNFMGQLVFIGNGNTKREAEQSCCQFRKTYNVAERQIDEETKMPKGERWSYPFNAPNPRFA